MTIDAPTGVTVVETADTGRESASYVDWAAIIAGVVFASAISLVLISFGSAMTARPFMSKAAAMAGCTSPSWA